VALAVATVPGVLLVYVDQAGILDALRLLFAVILASGGDVAMSLDVIPTPPIAD
jgi:hypothetical protein